MRTWPRSSRATARRRCGTASPASRRSSTSSSSSRSRSPPRGPPSIGCGAAADPLTPTRFLELTDAELLAIGFSRQKARYGRALAERDRDPARSTWTGSAGSTTTPSTRRSRRCPGIGPWTSTIYLLMVLGRPDVWPAGDIALAESVGQVKGLGRRPDAVEMVDARRGVAAVAIGRRAAVLARLPGASRPNRLERPGSASTAARRRPTYHRGLQRSDRFVQPARPAQPRPAHRRRDRERDRRGPEPTRRAHRGERHGRQPRRRTAGSRRPSARSCSRSARTPTAQGLVGTPDRVHRMYTELTAGYHVDPERLINGAIFDVALQRDGRRQGHPVLLAVRAPPAAVLRDRGRRLHPARPGHRPVEDPAHRRDVRRAGCRSRSG